MQIYAVGNILVEKDSLPLQLLPKLRKAFPQIDFSEIDPSENFAPPLNQPLYIIDTVVGIKEVTVFNDLNSFTKHYPVSLHDYGLLLHLKLLKKIGKLPQKSCIIGVPPDIDKLSALIRIQSFIRHESKESLSE